MKQHITPDQLNELSEEGKKRLRRWCENCCKECQGSCLQYLPLTDDTQTCGAIVGKEDWHPLLSIGQMIEFLDEHTDLEEEPDFKIISWHINRELCDALWEAVKEVLEK